MADPTIKFIKIKSCFFDNLFQKEVYLCLATLYVLRKRV